MWLSEKVKKEKNDVKSFSRALVELRSLFNYVFQAISPLAPNEDVSHLLIAEQAFETPKLPWKSYGSAQSIGSIGAPGIRGK